MAELILEEITWNIVRGSIEVHRCLGPGLLESTYRNCLEHELRTSGLQIAREVEIPVRYKGLCVEMAYRADLIVESRAEERHPALRQHIAVRFEL